MNVFIFVGKKETVFIFFYYEININNCKKNRTKQKQNSVSGMYWIFGNSIVDTLRWMRSYLFSISGYLTGTVLPYLLVSLPTVHNGRNASLSTHPARPATEDAVKLFTLPCRCTLYCSAQYGYLTL